MIPLKLTVKNFLCYRDNTPTLDLESVHLACLCGDNGHGKSALLDAITFALWGSSRLGDRNHDDLIHKGQSDMLVELEFESSGERYRVARRRARGRSQGRTGLEFFIRNSDGEWRAITGNTVRDTQEFITERIRMDHETFVNTAFLRQGDADRFTTSKPSDRKRILAEVLDLSYYDALEQRARDRVGELRLETQRLEADIEIREREAGQRLAHEEALGEVSREIAGLEPRLTEARNLLESGTRLVAELEGKKDELDKLIVRLPQAEKLLHETSERAERYRVRVNESEELILRQSEIEKGHSELTGFQEEDERLSRALNSKNEIELLVAGHRQQIAVERERLITQRDQQTGLIESMRAAASVIPQLEELLAKLRPSREKIEKFQARIEVLSLTEKQSRHKLEQMEGYRAEYEGMRERLLDLETRIFREKSRLESEVEGLTSTLARDVRPRAEALPGLLEDRDALSSESARLESLTGHIKEARERVNYIDGRVITLQGNNDRLREMMADTRQKFDLLESGDLECPLCGQELDSDGREHLRAEYEEIGMRSKADFQDNETEIAALTREREPLSQSISRMDSEFQAMSRQLQTRQGQLTARIEDAEYARKRAESLESEIADLKKTLEEESFMPEERNISAQMKELLDSIEFDPRDLDNLSREHRSITDDIRKSQQDLDELRADVDNAESEVNLRMSVAVQARDGIESAQKQLAPIVVALESGDFSQDARVQVERLEAEIGELGYDAAQHDEVRERIMDLIGFSKLRQQLDSALGQIEWDRVQLEQTAADLANLRSELSDMKERRDPLSVEVARLPEAQSELARCRVNCDDFEKRLTAARVRLGIAQDAVERCKRMAREAAELGRKRDERLRERSLYEELVIAFGRNGIQALIIEDALPQIENDSNDLLARLTDNRMSLKLQLTDGRRIRGSDALSEEMSIDISDEMGTRAYETFSGGEAFRINFALRIALSRLLARRSGAPLPILFIDEGFGSQDAVGQERLIEAIQSIRDDFDKIVVITHVEGIKEAFDTRIQVQKTEMGSTFEIIWA